MKQTPPRIDPSLNRHPATVVTLSAQPRHVLEQMRRELGPRFASPEQERFFDSQARELLYSGWMGAGKSRILCEKGWYIARTFPGVTVGLFRKVAASLPATTLRTFTRDVMDLGLIESRNLTESWYQLRNGSRVYFLGLDPNPVTGVPSKIGSLELGWAGVDEAVELSEGDWTMLMGRLRDPRVPYHQIAAATNPADPKHWLKVRFTPGDQEHEYLQASMNRMLPSDYQAILDALPDNAIGRRLGKGEWAAVEGAIWTLPPDQVKPPTQDPKRVVAGVDWGFVHQFAVEVVGQSGSGRLGVRAELYAAGKALDQLVEPWIGPGGVRPGIAQLCEEHDVSTLACDPSEPSLMAQLERLLGEHRGRHGSACRLRARVKAATNTVSTGLQAVDKAMRQGMTVDPSCAGLLGEIPGYTWAPNRAGGFHERPVEVGDDACDALRYAVMEFEPDTTNPWAGMVSAGGVA